MAAAERHLVWFLRFSALMFLSAAPAVIMPTAWMSAINDFCGLGPFPEVPLMGYLTRHMSALYACMGAGYWYISTDIRRYLPLVRFTVPLTFFQGLVIVAIGIAVDMPLRWTAAEGMSILAWTLALWWLARRSAVAGASG